MPSQSIPVPPDRERVSACSALTSCLSAHMFGVRRSEILSPTRRRARVAKARHAAIYLAHVGCRQDMEDIGRAFRRHRTSVRHACGRIEDRRDDRDFDWSLDLLEQTLWAYLAAFMPSLSAGRLP